MKVPDRIALFTLLYCVLLLQQIDAQQLDAPAAGEQQQQEQAKTQDEQKDASTSDRDPRKLVKDVQHIKEHLKEEYGFNDEQAEKYLQQYDAQTQFFLMHDYDNNTKLDGLELLKSMSHHHDEDESTEGKDETDQTDTLVEFVDMVMKDQDVNDDGFIDYPEYISYYTKFDKDAKPDS
eukprot:gene16814-18510_t